MADIILKLKLAAAFLALFVIFLVLSPIWLIPQTILYCADILNESEILEA